MKIRLKASPRAAAALKTARMRPKTADKASFLSPDDPNGSYTGVPADGGAPVQDVDDLWKGPREIFATQIFRREVYN